MDITEQINTKKIPRLEEHTQERTLYTKAHSMTRGGPTKPPGHVSHTSWIDAIAATLVVIPRAIEWVVWKDFEIFSDHKLKLLSCFVILLELLSTHHSGFVFSRLERVQPTFSTIFRPPLTEHMSF